jgi:hypothetical protein
MGAFEIGRRRGGDLLARPGGAGDGDEPRDQVGDDGAAGVAVAAHDVEHARRQELRRDLGQQQGGDGGRVRRLEDDGVAGSQRRGDLPDRHHERVVPGRDLPADADRLASDVRLVPGKVGAGRPALQDPGGTGEETQLVDGRRQLLRRGEGARLAGVTYLGVDQFVGARLDGVGELEQRPLPVRRGGVPPGLEGGRGGVHGGVDVARAGDGRGREHVPGAGVDQVAVAALGGLDVRAVDEVAQRLLVGHFDSPALRRGDWAAVIAAYPPSWPLNPHQTSPNATVSAYLWLD